MAKKIKRVHRGRDFWAKTVEDYVASGLSQAAFARKKRLKPTTLGRWVKLLGRHPAPLVGSELIEIVAAPREPLQQPRVPTGTTRLHVGGATVEFSDLPPVPYLAELLRTVSTC